MDTDSLFNVIGTIGGFAISLSLLPQVYLTYKTKCADDISYVYQFIYIFGTGLVNTYAIYYGLRAVYIPCLVEMCLIVTLTVMKWYYPEREDIVEIASQVAHSSLDFDLLHWDSHHHWGSSLFEASVARKAITAMKKASVEQEFDSAGSNHTSHSKKHIVERASSPKDIAVDNLKVEEAGNLPPSNRERLQDNTQDLESESGSSNVPKEGAEVIVQSLTVI